MHIPNHSRTDMVYGADFETDNDGTKAWITQWAVSNGEKEFHGPDLDSFLEFILDLWATKSQQTAKPKILLYFHNLSYDVQFLRAGIRRIVDEHNLDLRLTIRKNRPIIIRLQSTPNSLYFVGILEIRDSALKVPGTLRSLARTVGLEKLDPPKENFEPGWSKALDYSDDSEDWKYIDRDARIVAVAMKRLHKNGRSHATLSGDAWAFAKDLLRTSAQGKKYPNDIKWKSLFPPLDLDLDRTFRRGYVGGLNVSAHLGLNVATKDLPIVHEDVHSMYPTVMMYDPLPVGLPTVSYEKPSSFVKCWVMHCSIKLHLREGKIPWFQFKHAVDNALEGWELGSIVEDTYEWHELFLTNVDLALLEEWYEVEHNPLWVPVYWIFNSKTGIFKDYIEHWTKEKERAVKGSLEYVGAKGMLNSLYGRFALAPETEHYALTWDDDLGDYVFKCDEYTLNEDNDCYLPYSMFITAYARARLLENAAAVGPENVIHCDTDSVIHYGEPSDLIEHGEHLGTWGIESRPLRMYEGGFKRYAEILHEPIRTHHDIAMACAGVPQHVDKNDAPVGMWVEILDDPEVITRTGFELGHTDYCIKSQWLRDLYIKHGMDPDHVNTMKKIPEKVPGGVILRERRHILNDNMVYRLRR